MIEDVNLIFVKAYVLSINNLVTDEIMSIFFSLFLNSYFYIIAFVT